MAYNVINSSQLRTLLLFRTLDHIRKYECKHSSLSKYYFVSNFNFVFKDFLKLQRWLLYTCRMFCIFLTLLINYAIWFSLKKTQTICHLCVENIIKCTVCYKLTYIRYNRTYMFWWHTSCFPCIMFWTIKFES